MIEQVKELPNGVSVHQVTEEHAPISNIYCEHAWCPLDSRCFVFMRHSPEHAPNGVEFVTCRFGTWEKQLLGRGTGQCTMANGGRFYYARRDGDRLVLVRNDLETGESCDIHLPPEVPCNSRLDISKGERYVAYQTPRSFAPQRFGIGLADLRTGQCDTICEDPFICNPHHQFEPARGEQLLVQHNRGCRFSPDGRLERLVGDEGATLFLLDIPSGKRTPLPLGPPFTASLSGHEAWIGPTGAIITTLNIQEDYDHGKGPILSIRPGKGPQRVCAPWEMNHIATDPAGRLFAADTYEPDDIILGSPATGRAVTVCAARTSYARAPVDTHPHAYVTPNLKWVVFNSDRTGTQQIYAASIPSDMLNHLENGT